LPVRLAEPDPRARELIDTVLRTMLDELTAAPYIDELVVLSAAEFAAVVPSNAGSLRDDRVVYLALAAPIPVSSRKRWPCPGLSRPATISRSSSVRCRC
jgi:hypothetical protein